MKSVVRSFILPFRQFATFVIIICIIAVLEGLTAAVIKKSTVRATDVSCTVQSLEENGEKLNMLLDCAGSSEKLYGNAYIVSYVMKPRPLTCTLYEIGQPDCTFQNE